MKVIKNLMDLRGKLAEAGEASNDDEKAKAIKKVLIRKEGEFHESFHRMNTKQF